MTSSKSNEKGKLYTEIFKEWLEKNQHTSTLELIDWEDEENKIKVSSNSRNIKRIDKWRLIYKRRAKDKDEKLEIDLQTDLLLYKCFDEIFSPKRGFSCAKSFYHDEIKEIEQRLTKLTKYRKWKKRAFIFGTTALVIALIYLVWLKSEKEATTWNYV